MGNTLNMSPFAIILEPRLLGRGLGHPRHVLERPNPGRDHDRLRQRAELAMGGDSTVQGRAHHRVMALLGSTWAVRQSMM